MKVLFISMQTSRAKLVRLPCRLAAKAKTTLNLIAAP
jgi:hypothetical protein